MSSTVEDDTAYRTATSPVRSGRRHRRARSAPGLRPGQGPRRRGPHRTRRGGDRARRPQRLRKTTLLLVLAGLLVPDRGSVQVAGYDPVANGALARARTGWMPDTFGTWDSLTAREVLLTFAAAYRLPAATAADRVTELLATVHLTSTPTGPRACCPAGRNSGSAWPARSSTTGGAPARRARERSGPALPCRPADPAASPRRRGPHGARLQPRALRARRDGRRRGLPVPGRTVVPDADPGRGRSWHCARCRSTRSPRG